MKWFVNIIRSFGVDNKLKDMCCYALSLLLNCTDLKSMSEIFEIIIISLYVLLKRFMPYCFIWSSFVLRVRKYIMDWWNNGHIKCYVKKRKDAIIPKLRATGICPAEYLISCQEKASASCIEFQDSEDKKHKTPKKSKISKTPIKQLKSEGEINPPLIKKVKFDVPLEEKNWILNLHGETVETDKLLYQRIIIK